jgi:hypothetical protein
VEVEHPARVVAVRDAGGGQVHSEHDYGEFCAEYETRNFERWIDAQTGPDRTGALDGHAERERG